MRLKTLRKERPAFEIEGAVINGNRMDLSKSELKTSKHRSNTSFALPTSLHIEPPSVNISSTDQTHEMSTASRQPIIIPTASQPSTPPSYQAIEAACLEQGIRIRLSPTRSGQQSRRKSANNLQRHSAFVSRNPSRTSSVLHYTTTNIDQHHDSRPFSALQQTSSNDFEHNYAHNVSYAQSSQINEETYDDYLSPSIIASEQSNPSTPPEKLPITNEIICTTPITTLFENDPDLVYMSKLLQKPSGDSFRDTIRRRAGLRGTFSIHRHPLIATSIQPQQQQQPREKSPYMNQKSLTRFATIAVVPTPSLNKIDKDILKHASRLRRMSQSKDYLTKSPRIDSAPVPSSPSRNNNNNKPLKSISLEPLELLLSSAPRSASLSAHDLPSIKISSNTRDLKTTPIKRVKSAKTPIIENQNTTKLPIREHSTLSSILRDENLSLMKTSPLYMARQSNSFDSGYYDHSCSSVDVQSLTSSSIMQVPSSVPSARLTNSAARRSHRSKKVSFYDESTAVILTTATYV